MPAWSFLQQPDAVLINLGTNDLAKGDPGQPYEDAYVKLLAVVRSHYGKAWIFLTIGPMTAEPMLTTMANHLANVVTKVADPKVVKLDIPAQDATSTGCDYHPNVAEDLKMAEALRAPIASRLGW
jgi:lysophospholipase L1-like esterase